jgi:hypothetical protein
MEPPSALTSALHRLIQHATACTKCVGSGVLEVKPSRKLLHQHRVTAAAAAAAGAPPPPRPSRRRVSCMACGGAGLQSGPPPEPLGDEPPTVAIVGGGIGGAALALALQQRNVPVRIYERDGGFDERAQGYGLTMQQGATALSRLGVPNLGVFSTAHHSFLPDGCTSPVLGPSRKSGWLRCCETAPCVALRPQATDWQLRPRRVRVDARARRQRARREPAAQCAHSAAGAA